MFLHYSFYSRIYHSKPESVHKSKPRNVSFKNAERIAKRENFAHIRMHAKLEWFYRPFFFSFVGCSVIIGGKVRLKLPKRFFNHMFCLNYTHPDNWVYLQMFLQAGNWFKCKIKHCSLLRKSNNQLWPYIQYLLDK